MAGTGTNSIGQPLVAGLVTLVSTVAIGEVSKRLANAISGDPEEHEAQRYEAISRKIDQAQFHIPRPAEEGGAAPRKIVRQGTSKGQVMDHVHEALEQLDEAEKSTRCGVCIKGIKAAKKAVIENSQIIVRADSKYQIMQDLKVAGKIPKDATWATLNPKQKQFINQRVERSIQNV